MTDCNCAAGPWRYDVENAPYKPDVLVCSADGVVSLAARRANGDFITIPGRWSVHRVIAFSEIHPPEGTV